MGEVADQLGRPLLTGQGGGLGLGGLDGLGGDVVGTADLAASPTGSGSSTGCATCWIPRADLGTPAVLLREEARPGGLPLSTDRPAPAQINGPGGKP
ncbi:hypothetical protein ABIE67_000166 [Streptomyces sp. V4I8]|uniref:hypothetical protein n=1 Tax=Streptomyces sp. V4I8 TaxID=3156469 RepID=UPI00351440D9